VSLVREQDAPKFIAALRENYFMPLVAKGVATEQDLPACLFASSPAAGASVTVLQHHAAAAQAVKGSGIKAACADQSS
jgi:hypothetical protein